MGLEERDVGTSLSTHQLLHKLQAAPKHTSAESSTSHTIKENQPHQLTEGAERELLILVPSQMPLTAAGYPRLELNLGMPTGDVGL